MNFKKISFSTLVLSSAALLAAILLAGVVLYANQNAREDMINDATEQREEQHLVLAQEIATTLESETDRIRRELLLISEIPEIKSGSAEECSQKLKDIFVDTDIRINNIARTDEEGTFYCGVSNSIIGVDGTQYDYINEILEHRQPVLSRVLNFQYIDRSEYLIAIHIPVFVEGEFSGTLGGAIFIEDIEEKYLRNATLGKDVQFILQDDNGDIFVHPISALVCKNIQSEEAAEILQPSGGFQDVVKDILAENDGIGRYTVQGKEFIAAHAHAEVFEDRTWAVVISTPLSETMDSLDSLLLVYQYRAFVVVGLLVFLVITVLFIAIRWNLGLAGKIKKRTYQLELEKLKTETMLASIGDGVFAIDPDGKVTLFNRRAEKLTGYRAEDVIGKHYTKYLKFIYKKSKRPNTGFIKSALRGKSSNIISGTILKRRDGKSIQVGDSAAPIKNKKGEVTGAVIIFRDITKAKKLEQLKEEFSSLVSHELKTPISALKGFLELLEDSAGKKLTKKEKEYMNSSHDAAERLNNLVKDLLEVTRLEEGRMKLKPVLSDPAELAKETIEEVQDLFKEKKQEFALKAPDNLPKIKVDPRSVHMPLKNLLTNAHKYTPEKGKIEVHISKEDDKVLFAIKDNGAGIPEEEQEKVFQRFFRATNVTSVAKGTGLGLYISKLFVEKAKGTIWFESKKDKGTTFYFSIPASGEDRAIPAANKE